MPTGRLKTTPSYLQKERLGPMKPSLSRQDPEEEGADH